MKCHGFLKGKEHGFEMSTFKTVPHCARGGGVKLDLEFEELERRWDKLTPRERAAILVIAGIWDGIATTYTWTKGKRARKKESPVWLATALNILRDGGMAISNREIARRVGVSHSTLMRNETFRNARKTFVMS